MYDNIGKKALRILLRFSTSYECEQGFSTLVNIKTNKRMKHEIFFMNVGRLVYYTDVYIRQRSNIRIVI